MLDCDDEKRIARLHARGPEWRSRGAGELQDYVNWAAWMRRHAVDPSWRTDVIRDVATEGEMRWARWSDWRPGDPRWRVRIIDTSALPVERVAERLIEWIGGERAVFRAGSHPLAR